MWPLSFNTQPAHIIVIKTKRYSFGASRLCLKVDLYVLIAKIALSWSNTLNAGKIIAGFVKSSKNRQSINLIIIITMYYRIKF